MSQYTIPFNISSFNLDNSISMTSIHIPSDQQRLLQLNFIPDENDVLCGRGNECYNHNGNAKFRYIVQAFVQEYSNINNKHDKSAIINKVLYFIRSQSPNGGFVKKDLQTGRFFEVGDCAAVSTFIANSNDKIIHRITLHDIN